MSETTSVWVVIDIGCFECGVGTEPIGIFTTRDQAQAAADARNAETNYWRDGGQTSCEVFEMNEPNTTPTEGA